MEKQAVVLGDGTDADVVAFAQDELEAAVQVFYVRGGRVRGQRGWVVDKIEEIDTRGLVEQFLTQAYLDEAGTKCRARCWCRRCRRTPTSSTELLEIVRGGKVSLRVPQRGDKRALLETVERNAKEAFTRHKLKRSSDLTARSLALQELQDALELPEAPLRIECFDVSNLQGTKSSRRWSSSRTGSPARASTAGSPSAASQGQDDVAQHQRGHLPAVPPLPRGAHRDRRAGQRSRRPTRRPQPIDPVTGKPKKFAYPPQLVVVDGGPPQVAAAPRRCASSASPTSRSAGWPSGWRRSGCPTAPTR